jgi:hypothetical protein
MGPPGRCSPEFGMKWRVMLELVGPDGVVGVHEVGGRAAVAEYAPRMIGLTLEEGKHLLAALQVHLVRAQAEDHSRCLSTCLKSRRHVLGEALQRPHHLCMRQCTVIHFETQLGNAEPLGQHDDLLDTFRSRTDYRARAAGCGFLEAPEFGCKSPLSKVFCRRQRIG